MSFLNPLRAVSCALMLIISPATTRAAASAAPSTPTDNAPAALAPAATAPASAICVVCAVKHGEGEPEAVKASSLYDGKAFYFCSNACKQEFDAQPAVYAPPSLPRSAPAFMVRGWDGDTLSLAGYRGKVLLLDFWATWCAPCTKVMPDLQKLSDEFSGKGFEVLGISTDEVAASKVKAFVTKKGIRYRTAMDDEANPAWIAYNVRGLPSAYLIDRNGQLVRQWTGRADIAEVRAAVNALLGEKP